MTKRTLPAVEAFNPNVPIDWDAPVEARKMWNPVCAAKEGDRTISILDEIGDDRGENGVSAKMVAKFLSDVGSGDITVNINSPGGNFFDGLAIYNLLREHDGAVTTNVLGVAASAASIIAMASDKLRVAKSGFLMIHNSWGIVVGNRHDMTDVATVLGKFDASMSKVYAERSGIDAAEIAKMMDAETFLNGEEAVEAGFADEFLSSDEVKKAKESKSASALRLLDIQLAQDGLSRSERRALLADAYGDKPGAVPVVKPGADEDLDAIAAALRSWWNPSNA